MKAITLHQPYATLIALGVKTIETRSWSTSYRGPIAIHAGKAAIDPELIGDRTLDIILDTWGLNINELPSGCVVATSWLTSVERTEALRDLVDDDDLQWGNFAAGRFGWVLDTVVPLDPPVPARGSQGLWDWGGAK